MRPLIMTIKYTDEHGRKTPVLVDCMFPSVINNVLLGQRAVHNNTMTLSQHDKYYDTLSALYVVVTASSRTTISFIAMCRLCQWTALTSNEQCQRLHSNRIYTPK